MSILDGLGRVWIPDLPGTWRIRNISEADDVLYDDDYGFRSGLSWFTSAMARDLLRTGHYVFPPDDPDDDFQNAVLVLPLVGPAILSQESSRDSIVLRWCTRPFVRALVSPRLPLPETL